MVGGKYCFKSGCLCFEYLNISFPVQQQVSKTHSHFKIQFNLTPLRTYQNLSGLLAITAASAEEESFQYYRKI
jgi:hypothetical protein